MGRRNVLTTFKTNNTDIVTGGYTTYDVMQLVRAAKQRAEKKSVPFAGLDTLYAHTINELERNGHLCDCCRKPFQKKQDGKGGGGSDSLSLHRVTARKGYVPENVKIICGGCNTAIGEIQSDADLLNRYRALDWQGKIMGGGD